MNTKTKAECCTFFGSVKACNAAISDLKIRQGQDITVGEFMEYQQLIEGYRKRISHLQRIKTLQNQRKHINV